MSRLYLDNLVGPTRAENGRSAPSPLDLIPMKTEAFDEHLRRAGATTSTPDAMRDEPPRAPRAETAEDSGPSERPRKDEPAAKASDRDSEMPQDNAAAPAPSDQVKAKTNTATDAEKPTDDVGSPSEEDATEYAESEGAELIAAALAARPEDATTALPEEIAAAFDMHASEAAAQSAVAEEITSSTVSSTSADVELASTEFDTGPEEAAILAQATDTSGEPSDKVMERLSTAISSNASLSGNAAEASVQEDAATIAAPGAKKRPMPVEKTKADSLASDTEEEDASSTSDDAIIPEARKDAAEAATMVDATTALDNLESDAADSTVKPVSSASGRNDSLGDARTAANANSATTTEAATTRPTSDGNLTQADRAKFVERVAGAFRSANQGDGTVRMRLHPAELGSLRLEVNVRDGVLTARLQTDTPETRNLLLDNLPALRDRLAQQDIKIERFEVTYQDGSGGGWASQTGGDQQRRDPSGHPATGNAPTREADAPRAVEPRRAARASDSARLDVTV